MFAIFLFFFNDTATTEIYTLSLHDALQISVWFRNPTNEAGGAEPFASNEIAGDRKSTRLNSSHLGISYAVFCLKKKIKRTMCTEIKQREERSCGIISAPGSI